MSAESASEPKIRELPARPKAHWTSHFIRFRFVGFLVILGVMAWLLFPRSVVPPELREEEIAQQRLALFNGLKIWRALDEFQKQRGTDTAPYPSDIHQLDEMGITDDVGALLAVKPPFAGDWLYFSAADAENKEAPLLVSPRLAAKDRSRELKQQVVITVGGAVQAMLPEAVEKLIGSSATPPVKVRATIVP